MNPKHYHTPALALPQRRRCPVCHQSVYSRAGIHPQCAMKQSEPFQPHSKKHAAAAASAPVAAVTPGADLVEVAPVRDALTLPSRRSPYGSTCIFLEYVN